jgi:hypothetical protein
VPKYSFQLKDESVPSPSGATVAQKLVTADGTYATQSAFSADAKSGSGKAKKDKVMKNRRGTRLRQLPRARTNVSVLEVI